MRFRKMVFGEQCNLRNGTRLRQPLCHSMSSLFHAAKSVRVMWRKSVLFSTCTCKQPCNLETWVLSSGCPANWMNLRLNPAAHHVICLPLGHRLRVYLCRASVSLQRAMRCHGTMRYPIILFQWFQRCMHPPFAWVARKLRTASVCLRDTRLLSLAVPRSAMKYSIPQYNLNPTHQPQWAYPTPCATQAC